MSQPEFATSAHYWAGSRSAAAQRTTYRCERRVPGRRCGFAAGLPTQYAQDSDTVFHQSQNMYFVFAQDDWKATRKLTINYGVRYEFATPPLERDNQSANYDPAARAFVAAKEGGLFERSLIHAGLQQSRASFRIRIHCAAKNRAPGGLRNLLQPHQPNGPRGATWVQLPVRRGSNPADRGKQYPESVSAHSFVCKRAYPQDSWTPRRWIHPRSAAKPRT